MCIADLTKVNDGNEGVLIGFLKPVHLEASIGESRESKKLVLALFCNRWYLHNRDMKHQAFDAG